MATLLQTATVMQTVAQPLQRILLANRLRYLVPFIALLAGCSSERAIEPLRGGTGRLSIDCTDEPPTAPGCPVFWQYNAGELATEVAQAVGNATGAEPLWSGQQFSALMEGQERFCPGVYTPSRISVYVPEFGESAVFYNPGTAYLQAIIGYSVLGFPMARYGIPTSILISSVPEGKYKFTGGVTLYVRCEMVRVRTSRGTLVEGGRMLIYNVEGNLTLNEGAGNGGVAGRGWAFREVINGQQYSSGAGEGSDWQAALDQWIETGQCTPGWAIVVDGIVECDGT